MPRHCQHRCVSPGVAGLTWSPDNKDAVVPAQVGGGPKEGGARGGNSITGTPEGAKQRRERGTSKERPGLTSKRPTGHPPERCSVLLCGDVNGGLSSTLDPRAHDTQTSRGRSLPSSGVSSASTRASPLLLAAPGGVAELRNGPWRLPATSMRESCRTAACAQRAEDHETSFPT